MLERLALTDFRNHASALLTPGPGFVVLTGDNGAGKTNVLEAVSLLAPGRGLRRAPLSQMARQGGAKGNGGGFGVAARMDGVDLATGTRIDAPERRLVRVNGAPAAATALAEWLTISWLTPAMDRLFMDAAGERRRFLDRLTLALTPGHAVHANRYEAAMRARTRLLGSDVAPDPAWLSALEAQMAEHGAAIDRGRRAMVDALTERLAGEDDGQFPAADILLDGWNGGDLAHELMAARARDAAAGRALAGPHRQDLLVTHRAKRQAAALCSTGEQKALLLGIVLAHADLIAARGGLPPVLLLDEVAAHLDPARRGALFARLEGRGQVWMTGTERAPFSEIGAASWFRVADGTVHAD
jgi:DNA replication and repair protein RecF